MAGRSLHSIMQEKDRCQYSRTFCRRHPWSPAFQALTTSPSSTCGTSSPRAAPHGLHLRATVHHHAQPLYYPRSGSPKVPHSWTVTKKRGDVWTEIHRWSMQRMYSKNRRDLQGMQRDNGRRRRRPRGRAPALDFPGQPQGHRSQLRQLHQPCPYYPPAASRS